MDYLERRLAALDALLAEDPTSTEHQARNRHEEDQAAALAAKPVSHSC